MPDKQTETRYFSFYGQTRVPGVHPGERISEREEFEEDVLVIRDADGEPAEWRCIPESSAAMYAAVRERAMQLLEIWPDQNAIRIHECETSGGDDIFVYREVA